VPASWEPNDKHRALARKHGVDFELELEKFRDHEFKEPKTKADLAFNRWLRTANTFSRPPGFQQHQQTMAEERKRPELAPIRTPQTGQEASPLEVLAHVGQVLGKRPAAPVAPARKMTAAELDRAVEELARERKAQ